MTTALLAFGGFVLLSFSLRARLGRSASARSWAAGGWPNESAVLFVLPGLGLVLLPAALLQVVREGGSAEVWLAAPVLLGLLLCGWGLLALKTPRWYAPSWLRASRQGRRGT